jgi:hypothetical protein
MNSMLTRIPAIPICCLALILCMRLAAEQRKDSGGVGSHQEKGWAPPDVDAPLHSVAALPPCPLSRVLEQAGAHTVELTTNLEKFTAQEQINYEMLGKNGFSEESDSSAFDYVFAFEQSSGRRASREYRTPAKRGHSFPASGQDTGQAALALIFLPNMQTDYEMSCEGLDEWNGELAWVIHFQQRKDKPCRTLQFRTEHGVYPVMLKGRAWISMDNSQVLHLETNLMQGVPAMNLRSSAISVNYALVRIQSMKLELWLPQSVESFWAIGDHRVILSHIFTNFKLFSVETEENIQKPKDQ